MEDQASVRHIGVLTSGGDAPGMNAAIRAVVRQAVFRGVEVTGILKGYTGLIRGEFRRMDTSSVSDIIHRGGTILRTSRCQELFHTEGRRIAEESFRQAGFEGLVVIGGDGSFRGALALRRMGVPVVGVPATIDNDIAGTDFSIGFDTAVNTAVEAINKIRDTATSHERVFLIEVMGHNSGHIALAVSIAGGAESILVPEIETDIGQMIERICRGHHRGKLHSIILVAEGVGREIDLIRIVKERTGLDTRVSILGHIQRGGTPSAFDRILASRLGAKAVDVLLSGSDGLMIGIKGNQVRAVSMAAVLRQQKKFSMEDYQLAQVLSL